MSTPFFFPVVQVTVERWDERLVPILRDLNTTKSIFVRKEVADGCCELDNSDNSHRSIVDIGRHRGWKVEKINTLDCGWMM